MDKIKIGIPRALHYYYYDKLWTTFLEELGFEVITSRETTKKILEQGCHLAHDEMCLSLKIFLGHILDLDQKCDYIFVPRIDNYGIYEQTCTNFLALPDLVKNKICTPILTYNVDYKNRETEMNAFIKLGLALKKGREQSKLAYFHGKKELAKQEKKQFLKEIQKLKSSTIKILVISHPYNFEDAYIGKTIQKILTDLNVTYIDGQKIIGLDSSFKGSEISPTLYWKYNKELIGTIKEYQNQIDGILFISSFPCGPDSLVNELLFRKITRPYLNLIVDEESGSAGMETRLESFIDILEQKVR